MRRFELFLVRRDPFFLTVASTRAIAFFLYFRAARRAAFFPPKIESLNIFVTAVVPRRK